MCKIFLKTIDKRYRKIYIEKHFKYLKIQLFHLYGMKISKLIHGNSK